MKAYIIASLSSYILTLVIAKGSILAGFRGWLKQKTPHLKLTAEHPHFIECRLCVGFWSSLMVCNTSWEMILPVYGLSYFLATQER